MLQDALTDTEVTWASPIPTSDIATSSARRPQIEWPKPALCAAIVGRVSTAYLLVQNDPDATAYLLKPINPYVLDVFTVEQELERAVVNEIGVRALVGDPPPPEEFEHKS